MCVIGPVSILDSLVVIMLSCSVLDRLVSCWLEFVLGYGNLWVVSFVYFGTSEYGKYMSTRSLWTLDYGQNIVRFRIVEVFLRQGLSRKEDQSNPMVHSSSCQ